MKTSHRPSPQTFWVHSRRRRAEGMPTSMKSFEALFAELKDKAVRKDSHSGTVRHLENGVHAIGKKVIEEACEVWMAAEHEGRERTAEEISQLLYHVQVMMIACELDLEDVYRYL
jgi:phosphoribosyl-ATP pyrophosphohydrolase